MHKSIYVSSDWFGLTVFATVLAICNVGGIGGGGVANPLIKTFFHFSAKEAVAISSLTIMMSSVARYIYTFRAKNPEKPYTVLVDYNLASIMMPASLAGSQTGILIFAYLSHDAINILVIILLVVLLI